MANENSVNILYSLYLRWQMLLAVLSLFLLSFWPVCSCFFISKIFSFSESLVVCHHLSFSLKNLSKWDFREINWDFNIHSKANCYLAHLVMKNR